MSAPNIPSSDSTDPIDSFLAQFDDRSTFTLHHDVGLRNIESLKKLLKESHIKKCINSEREGITALGFAASLGEIESCAALIKAGADPKIGKSPLCLAAVSQVEMSDNDLCELFGILIKAGADVNKKMNMQNSIYPSGTTVLHIFTEEENYKLCELLIKNGADVNLKRDSDGASPLDIVRSSDNDKLKKLFKDNLGKQPNSNAQNPNGDRVRQQEDKSNQQ